MEYLQAERDSNRIKGKILTRKNFSAPMPKNKKLLLIMRHRTNKIASPQVKKILGELRLRQKHSCIFAVASEKLAAYLTIIEPYVTYGTPNIALVRDLIFKFGKMHANGKKTSIQSNVLVEEHMGHMGIICVEDIIHSIINCSDNFNDVNGVLLPFMLKAPRDGWKKKLNRSFKVGGEYGDRGDGINELIPLCM